MDWPVFICTQISWGNQLKHVIVYKLWIFGSCVHSHLPFWILNCKSWDGD